MTCDHCGRRIPDGVFCTVCGAHQDTVGELGSSRARLHRYAAHPAEHVAQPNVFSTILPHLGGHRVHEFRAAFIAGMAALVILYATGLILAAILLAALLVPTLYLIYLYEAQVYGEEPGLVLGLSVGAGLLLGIVVTTVINHLVHPVDATAQAVNVGTFLLLTVLVPVIQEVVKAAPVMPLLSRFTESIDGLVFGVAAGLGFALAETLINFQSVLTSLPFRSDTTGDQWIYPLITIAVFLPLLQGTCTGAVCAAISGFRRGGVSVLEASGIVVALVGHIGFVLVSQLLQDNDAHQLVVLAWQAFVVAAVVIYIRFLLHAALIEEAADFGYRQTVCVNCHKHVVAAGFCPACGMALSASPRRTLVTAGEPAAEPVAAAGASGEGV